MCVCVCVRVCVIVCVYVFMSYEITYKTKMIVFTEASLRCEIDLTMLLQISFLFSVSLGLAFELGLCKRNISSKHSPQKIMLV